MLCLHLFLMRSFPSAAIGLYNSTLYFIFFTHLWLYCTSKHYLPWITISSVSELNYNILCFFHLDIVLDNIYCRFNIYITVLYIHACIYFNILPLHFLLFPSFMYCFVYRTSIKVASMYVVKYM